MVALLVACGHLVKASDYFGLENSFVKSQVQLNLKIHLEQSKSSLNSNVC